MQKEKIQFYNAEEISSMLGVSKSTAYRLIKSLNDDLKDEGKIVIGGKISARYFESKIA